MAKFKKQTPFLALLITLGLSVLAAGCGQGASSNVTVTTSGPSKTPATTSTAPVAKAAPEAAQYAAELQSWMAKYWDNIDAGAFTFSKPTAPTAKEIQRAQAMVDQQLSSVEALKLIKTPAALAATHAQYIGAIAGEANAAQRMVEAIKNGSRRDTELAMRDMNTARALEVKTMGALENYMARYQEDSTSSVEGEGLVIFSDSKLGFSIQYPKSWEEYPSLLESLKLPADGAGMAIGDPSGGKFGTKPANLILFGAEPYDPKADGSSLAALEKDLAELSEEYTTLNPAREFRLNGLNAAEATVSISPRGHTLLLRTIYAHTNRVSFSFQLCAEAKSWDAENAVFDAVVNSLMVQATL